jgi:hypothetical protein
MIYRFYHTRLRKYHTCLRKSYHTRLRKYHTFLTLTKRYDIGDDRLKISFNKWSTFWVKQQP